MEPDDAADLINEVDQERRLPILESLPHDQQTKVRQLLSYNADSAGGLMNTDFVSVGEAATVRDALDAIRSSNVPVESLHAVFLLDGEGRPVGAVSLGSLVKAREDDTAASVARNTISHVHAQWDVHRVTRVMSDFNLTVLPVLDETHDTMLGVITVDDLLEELLPQGWRKEFGMTGAEQ